MRTHGQKRKRERAELLPGNKRTQPTGSRVGMVRKALARQSKDGLIEGQLLVQMAIPEEIGTFSRPLIPKCVPVTLHLA